MTTPSAQVPVELPDGSIGSKPLNELQPADRIVFFDGFERVNGPMGPDALQWDEVSDACTSTDGMTPLHPAPPAQAEPAQERETLSDEQIIDIFVKTKAGNHGAYIVEVGREIQRQVIASLALSAKPVAHFLNSSAPGHAPHYEQVATEYIGTEGTFPLFATPPAPTEQADREDAARLDWIEAEINNKGAVWLLPCGEDLRFVQIRTAEDVANFPTVLGLRAAIDAARASQAQQPGPTEPAKG